MRLLHTMLRVKNLEESLDFYCTILGMKLLRQKDYPGGKFTLAFVGYGNESENTVLELTYNWDNNKYDFNDYNKNTKKEKKQKEKKQKEKKNRNKDRDSQFYPSNSNSAILPATDDEDLFNGSGEGDYDYVPPTFNKLLLILNASRYCCEDEYNVSNN